MAEVEPTTSGNGSLYKSNIYALDDSTTVKRLDFFYLVDKDPLSVGLGSMQATGLSRTRRSHTLTRPSLEPVTSSGVPLPIPIPPTPSIQLIIESCALNLCTEPFSRCSKSQTSKLP